MQNLESFGAPEFYTGTDSEICFSRGTPHSKLIMYVYNSSNNTFSAGKITNWWINLLFYLIISRKGCVCKKKKMV